MTATATLTAADLEVQITATEATIESLQHEMNKLAIRVLRHEEGSPEAYKAAEAKLDAARHSHRLASDAIVALGAEEAAAAEEAHAKERAKQEVRRAKANKKLETHLGLVEHAVAYLAEQIQPALSASDEVYNAGLALGITSSSSTSNRDRITAYISRILRLAGLPDFDLGTDRGSLTGEAGPIEVSEPSPLPPRRDTRDMEHGYPGQNLESRKIIKSELQDADGVWHEVPVGSVDWPTAEQVQVAEEENLGDLEAAAKERQKRVPAVKPNGAGEDGVLRFAPDPR